MNYKKEIAKFFSGALAFHALVHVVLLFSGNPPITVLGIERTVPVNAVAAVISVFLAVLLGWYAWSGGRRTTEAG